VESESERREDKMIKEDDSLIWEEADLRRAYRGK